MGAVMLSEKNQATNCTCNRIQIWTVERKREKDKKGGRDGVRERGRLRERGKVRARFSDL